MANDEIRKGVVSVRPIHVRQGTPGMVVVRVGDDTSGSNTALEANEALELAQALIIAAAAAMGAKHMPDGAAIKLMEETGEARI